MWRNRIGRVGWGIADQGVSSLTNFIVAVFVARSVSPNDFGAFAIAFTTYLTAMGFCRAVAAEPLVVRYTSASSDARQDAIAAANGLAVVVGVLLGGVCVLGGVAIGGTLGDTLIALGLLLPGLLLQDSWRFAFFAAGHGAAAFLNDLVWGVVLVPVMLVVLFVAPPTAPTFVFAWGAAATVAAIFGIAQTRTIPRPQESLSWLRTNRDLASRFLAESMTMFGVGQIGVSVIGAVAGLSAVGAFRAAHILFGPVAVLGQATGLAGVPESIRIMRRGRERLFRAAIALSLAMLGAAVIWGGVLLVLPATLGEAILGPTWEGARSILVPLLIALCGTAANSGAVIGLRALAAARRSLRARIALSMIGLLISIGGVVTAGIQGVAWGSACSAWIGAAVWWSQFRGALRYQPLAPSEADSPEYSFERTGQIS